jgi:hypothetical protein
MTLLAGGLSLRYTSLTRKLAEGRGIAPKKRVEQDMDKCQYNGESTAIFVKER